MPTLSERLEAHANSWPTVYESDRMNIAILREAAALAKRYEDAPVGVVNERGGSLAAIYAIVGRLPPEGKFPAVDQRVRILLDTEGV